MTGLPPAVELLSTITHAEISKVKSCSKKTILSKQIETPHKPTVAQFTICKRKVWFILNAAFIMLFI